MPKIAAIDRMVPEQCMPKLTHHRLQRCYMGVLTVVRGALWQLKNIRCRTVLPVSEIIPH